MTSFRSKLLIWTTIALAAAFVFFISEPGQVILRGRMPPDATPFQRDDIEMGVALAPWVYGLPLVLLCGLSTVVSYILDKRRDKRALRKS